MKFTISLLVFIIVSFVPSSDARWSPRGRFMSAIRGRSMMMADDYVDDLHDYGEYDEGGVVHSGSYGLRSQPISRRRSFRSNVLFDDPMTPPDDGRECGVGYPDCCGIFRYCRNSDDCCKGLIIDYTCHQMKRGEPQKWCVI